LRGILHHLVRSKTSSAHIKTFHIIMQHMRIIVIHLTREFKFFRLHWEVESRLFIFVISYFDIELSIIENLCSFSVCRCLTLIQILFLILILEKVFIIISFYLLNVTLITYMILLRIVSSFFFYHNNLLRLVKILVYLLERTKLLWEVRRFKCLNN
jgi:hypothetical protein